MMWTFGVGQLIVYTFGLPMLVFVFLWRNRNHLQDQIPMTRYGLFYGAYKPSCFYWEVVITARKVSIVMLSVFGPAMGPILQAQVALLIFLICIVVEIYGDPYFQPTEEHKLLRRMELGSLLAQWWTMWSGLVIFQLGETSVMAMTLTVLVVGGNALLLLWSLYQFVRAKIRESKEEKRLKLEREALEEEEGRVPPHQVTSFRNKISSLVGRFGGEVQMVSMTNPNYRGGDATSGGASGGGASGGASGGADTRADASSGASAVKKHEPRLKSNPLAKLNKGKGTKGGTGTQPSRSSDSSSNGSRSNSSSSSRGRTLKSDHRREKDGVGVKEIKSTVSDSGGDLVTGALTPPAANSDGTSNKLERRSFIKVTNSEIGEADYFQDIETEETVWAIPVDGDLVTGAPTSASNSNGTTDKSKRRSFIKVTNNEIGGADYFQDIETKKTVWEIPADGDLVNM